MNHAINAETKELLIVPISKYVDMSSDIIQGKDFNINYCWI
jgi:hypothetical protein